MNMQKENNNFVISKYHVFWSISLITLSLVFFLIREILLPFLVSFVFVALFINIVNYLENKFKIPRGLSSFTLVATTMTLLIYVIYVIIPFTIKSVSGYFIGNSALIGDLTNLVKELSDPIIHSDNAKEIAVSIIQNGFTDVFAIIHFIVKYLINSSVTAFTFIGFILLSPILTFMMLKDMPKISKTFYELIPLKYQDTVKSLMSDMHHSVFNYMNGQFVVAVFLTFFYGLLLVPFNVNKAFVIGGIVGFASFIPYIGFYIASGIGLIMVYNQFQDTHNVLLVAGVLIFGQIIEGNFITPKVIGDKLGIHPVWVIFGMLASIPLFGIIGVIMALPLTGIAGVIIRFAIKKYKNSSYYLQK